MKVIDLGERRRARQGAPSRPSPEAETVSVHGRLLERLGGAGDLLPDDPELLRPLLGGVDVSEDDVRRAVGELLAADVLRRVVVGRQPHLARGPRAASLVATLPCDRADAAADASGAFQLRVAIDVETERVLLYRVALVVAALVGAIFARGLLVTWLGP